jgi:hypothetical protein
MRTRILSPLFATFEGRGPLPPEPVRVLRIGLVTALDNPLPSLFLSSRVSRLRSRFDMIVDLRGAVELFVARMLDAIRNG